MSKDEIVVQKWKDIPDYSILPNTKCHLCNTAERVKEGEIPVIHYAMVRSIVMGRTYWQLCQACHDEGWEPDKESGNGRIRYFNKKGSYPVAIKTIC